MPLLCPQCHQGVLSTYYFCPNCGAKLDGGTLSTTAATQAWIYFFSIILPMFCFLFVTRWPGLKYYRSTDPKAKQIGLIAIILIILSTVLMAYWAYVWAVDVVQSSVASINANIGATGM